MTWHRPIREQPHPQRPQPHRATQQEHQEPDSRDDPAEERQRVLLFEVHRQDSEGAGAGGHEDEGAQPDGLPTKLTFEPDAERQEEHDEQADRGDNWVDHST